MSDVRPIRFGYVGAGFLAQSVHIPNFASLPGCEFVALAESRSDIGPAVAQRYGIGKVVRSHLDLAEDPTIEAVGVSAAFAAQGEIALDLAKAGKHVFMEKPMAVTLEKANAIVEASRVGGGRVMVAYMKRYDPGNRLLKATLDTWREKGDMGRILLARNHGFGGNWLAGADPNVPVLNSSEPYPPSPTDRPAWLPEDRREGYLGYLQQWTHNLNLLRFFLGGAAEVVSVDLDERDGMTGVVVLKIGGVRAVLESGYTWHHGWEEHTHIYFQGGYLRTEAPCLLQKEVPASVEVYQSARDGQPPTTTHLHPPAAWSYREEAKHFLDAIRNGTPFESSAEDTVADVALYEQIYQCFLSIS